jgi:hypothetical protein
MISLVAIGLIYNIAGSIIIMRAFGAGYAQVLLVQSAAHGSTDESMFRAFAAQRVDGRFGGAFLFAGFGLLLLPAMGVESAMALQVFSLVAGAIALLYYMLMRDQLAIQGALMISAAVKARPAVPALAAPQPVAMPLVDLTPAEATQ